MSVADNLMLAPDVGRFVQTLRSDLSRRKSVFLLTPTDIKESEVWLALYSHIERDFDVDVIDLAELASGDAIASLGSALQVQRGLSAAPCTLSDLAGTPKLPDILYLSGLETLSADLQKEWLAVLSRWARLAQRCQDSGIAPMALCLLVSAEALQCPPPEADVFLSVRWWWSVPSIMDVRGLCRLHHGGVGSSALSQWREHLLPALAGSDTSLADYLWDSLEQSSDLLMEALRAFGLEKGWNCSLLQKWGCRDFLSQPAPASAWVQRPPEEWRHLWARSVLSYTPEHGCELHSAALAILDMRALIQHRVWRGQAALLLPLIDAARLKVCQSLTDAYGHGWPLRKRPINDYELPWIQEDPSSCQLGHLRSLLADCFEPSEKRRWYRLIVEANEVRNDLAHYRPVTFEDYKRFAEALQAAE